MNEIQAKDEQQEFTLAEKLWNRIADKLYHEHKTDWIKPTNITTDPTELRRLYTLMGKLEDKRLAYDASSSAWVLLSNEADEYKDPLNVDMPKPLFKREDKDG